MIRAQIYKMFEREIDTAYTSAQERLEGAMKLDLKGLEGYVMKLGREIVGP